MLSGPFVGVAASVAGLAAVVVVLAENGTAYFPPDHEQPSCVDAYQSLEDPSFTLRETRVPMDRDARIWVSTYLRTAGEPSLYLASTGQEPRQVDAIRLTRLVEAVAEVVRVDFAQGAPRLVASEVQVFRTESGGVGRRVDRALTRDEAEHLEGLLSRSDLFANAGGACSGYTPDTLRLVLEQQSGSSYKVANYQVIRPYPGYVDPPIEEVSDYLWSLTGWRPDQETGNSVSQEAS